MRHARIATIGFILLLVLSLFSSLSDILTIREISRHQDQARAQALNLADVERLRYYLEKQSAASTAYVLTRDESFVQEFSAVRANFDSLMTSLSGTSATPEGRHLLDMVQEMQTAHQRALAMIYDRAAEGEVTSDELRIFRETESNRAVLDKLITALANRKMERVREENRQSQVFSNRAKWFAVVVSMVLLLAGIGLALYLTRAIRERERMEQRLFEEVVQQNRDTQRIITELREERDAATKRLTNLLP